MSEPVNSDGHNEDEPKSKSQLKREFKAYQELGMQLVELPKKQLETIPLSDFMRTLIIEAQAVKHGTLHRQMRLVGSRMPDEDLDAIDVALKTLKQPRHQVNKETQKIEQWCDKLLQDDNNIFSELSAEYDGFDRQYVSQLIRNAKKEVAQKKSPKSAQLLLQYLTELKNSTE